MVQKLFEYYSKCVQWIGLSTKGGPFYPHQPMQNGKNVLLWVILGHQRASHGTQWVHDGLYLKVSDLDSI